MAKKAHLASLLMMAMLIAGAATALGQLQDQQRAAGEEVTREEEREALLIAEQFVRGFEDKNNVLALIDELYVKDFDARLRPDLNSYLYLASVEPEVMERATNEDLRRFYAASLGFHYAGAMVYGVNEYRMKLKRDRSGEDGGARIDELLPSDAIEVMKTDPLLAQMIAEAERENQRKGSGETGEAEAETVSKEIKSLERMRSYSAILEKASALIREHLKSLPSPRTWNELTRVLAALDKTEGESEEKGPDEARPRVNILDRDFFGCPRGTRILCLKVLCFRMDLVRVEGQLRVLNVYVAD